MKRLNLSIVLYLFIFGNLYIEGNDAAKSFKDYMYTSVFGYPCTRLADKDRLIGCSSSRNGDHGALWPIEIESDVDEFVKGNPGSRIAVFNSTAFTHTAVTAITKAKHLTGIIVLPGPQPAAGFSPEEVNPNVKYGLYPTSTYQWNPIGNGMNYMRFDFPIFYLPSGMASYFKIYEHASANRKGKSPQFGFRFNSWMHASGPADVCMRRGQCDPLGGKSVWSTITGAPVDTQKRIIMVITQADAIALFHDMAIGADAGVSGRASLLLAAEALARTIKNSPNDNPFTNTNTEVIFAFFEGERWGYLGSKRFVRDIVQFSCSKEDNGRCLKPFATTLKFKDIDFSKIDVVLEVGQVGNISSAIGSPTIFMHSDAQNPSQNLKANITSVAAVMGLSVQSATAKELPPSASMAFLKAKQIPNVVLAEHGDIFTNKHYGSHFDDYSNVNVQGIVLTADLLANTIISLVNSSYVLTNATRILVNGSLAGKMVGCLSNDMNCDLVSQYMTNTYVTSDPTSYVGVWGADTISSFPAKFTHDFLFDIATREVGKNCSKETCDDGYECIRDFCMKSGTYYHDALTTGLNFDYHKWKFEKTSLWETESTWTESRWTSVGGELYEIPGSGGDIAQFVIGFIYVVACFIAVYALKGNMLERFKS